MTQPELIKSILQYMVLEKNFKKHDTPFLKQPFLKHESSKTAPDEGWKYWEYVSMTP